MLIETLFEHGSGVANEDFLIMEDDCFGVFDGATSLYPTTYEHGYTGGFLASTMAGAAFKQGSGNLIETAEQANRSIRTAMIERKVDLTDKGNLWSTSAAVVRIRDDRLEWVQIGDCQIFCILDTGAFESQCEIPDQDNETLSRWKDVCRTTEAPIGVAMHEQILKVRKRMNMDYGVFSGEPEAMQFLKSGSRTLEGVRHILLFTDGLLLPEPRPWQGRDFTEHMTIFQSSGLIGVRNRIREIEATDVHCRDYPRFKTHDDIAAIAIGL